MKKIDKSAYQARLDRITELFENMAPHATEQSSFRCPYKNRFNECTAVFGCRNQRKPKKENLKQLESRKKTALHQDNKS